MLEDKTGLFTKMKNVLLSPNKFFDSIKQENKLRQPFIYLLVLSTLYILFTFVISYLGLGSSFVISKLTLLTVVILYIITIVANFILSGIIHLFVKLFKGEGNYLSTFKAVIYSSTPALLFGWIPFISIIPGLYSLYLEIRGLSILHQISFIRALLSSILAIVIIGAIGVVLSFVFLLRFS